MATDTAPAQTIKPLVLIISLLALQSGASTAAEMQLSTRLDVEEVYTDNVELSTEEEVDSLVSLVSPGINLEYQAGRANLGLDYTFTHAMYSHDHDLDDDYNTLSAEGGFRLWPDGLRLDFSGSIRNVSANTANNSLADLVSGDTVEYRSYQAGLSYLVDNSAFIIDARANWVKTDAEDNIGERDGYYLSLTTQNGVGARHIFWDGLGNYSDYENSGRSGRFHTVDVSIGYITGIKLNPFIRVYDEDTSGNLNNAAIVGTSSIGAGVRWQATNHLQLDLSYNFVDDEDVEQDNQVSEQSEDYLAATVNWQPSQRTQFNGRYYQRFFGDAYQASFNHRSKRLTNTLSYNERINAFDRLELVPTELIDVWCLAGTAPSDDNCVFDPGADFDLSQYTFAGFTSNFELAESNTFTLTKSFRATSTLALLTTKYSISLLSSKRENLDIGDYDKLETASFNINKQLSRVMSAFVNFSFRKNSLDNNNPNNIEQIDYYRIYRLGVKRQLNRTLEFNSYVQHLNRRSNRFGLTYEENRVSLQLVKRF